MATAFQRILLGAFLLAIVASCANKSDVIASPTLQNIYWKLVELNGKPVTVADNQQEPHIVLRDSQPPALGGSGGCNRLRGTYALEGDAIIFDRIEAGTLLLAGAMTGGSVRVNDVNIKYLEFSALLFASLKY